MFRLARFLTQYKLVRFIISGGTAFCITTGTVFVLTEWYSVRYLAASTIGFLVSVTVNFMMQKYWTFRERSLKEAHRQTVSFFSVNTVNLVLNGLLMTFFVEHVSLRPVLAQVATAITLAFESFIAYSIIFRRRASTEDSFAGNENIIEPQHERAGTDVV